MPSPFLLFNTFLTFSVYSHNLQQYFSLFAGSKQIAKLGLEMKKSGFGTDYSENINPAVSNSFSTAAMKFRYSMMDGNIELYNEDRSTDKSLKLRDHYNEPETIETEGHFDSLVRGLASQTSQKNDLSYSTDVSSSKNIIYVYKYNVKSFPLVFSFSLKYHQ